MWQGNRWDKTSFKLNLGDGYMGFIIPFLILLYFYMKFSTIKSFKKKVFSTLKTEDKCYTKKKIKFDN